MKALNEKSLTSHYKFIHYVTMLPGGEHRSTVISYVEYPANVI